MLDGYSQNTGPTSDDGMTSGRSRRNQSLNGKSTALLAVSRVKTSALQEQEQVSTASEADCSSNSCESFAFYDRDSSSWRTWQTSLFGGWVEFSESWPRAGTMRNGIACQRQPLAPTTRETGFLLLRTPNQRDGRSFYVISQESARKRIQHGGRQLHWIHQLIEQSGLKRGYANPRFSEALMGFPRNWLNINWEPSETPSSQPSPSSSGAES